MEFTREQRAVIDAEPGNLLISAAAGSGKTTVLSERIVQRVLGGKADIRSLLVMTFTEAAAANMRRKIADRLREELALMPDGAGRARLSRQISALPRASLSTIHAFCLEVFRSFQYLLQDEDGRPLAEPGSGVLDPTTAGILLNDALDRVLTAFYNFCDEVEDGGEEAAKGSVPVGLPAWNLQPKPLVFGRDPETARSWTASFQVLCDGFSPGRDDRQLRALALSLHAFLRSMPEYEQWSQTMLDRMEDAARDFAGSEWADTLVRQMEVLLDKASSAIPRLRRQLDCGLTFVKDVNKNAEYLQGFRILLAAVEEIAAEVAQSRLGGGRPDWDRLVGLAAGLPAPALTGNSRDAETKDFLEEFIQYIPEAVYALTGRMGTGKYSNAFEFDTLPLFTRHAADIGKDIGAMVSPVRRLMEIVLLADRVYTGLKNQERSIDFSDFEHFALRILKTDEARAYYRERFSEIYIDECQDTSSIQDEIVSSVADANVFMVGDVKQSIYRFRHANPTLFLERSRAFAAGEGGMQLDLNRNFRSTRQILAAVNRLFRQILTETSGEIDYDDAQALVPADAAPTGEAVRLLLVDVHRAVPLPDASGGEDQPAVQGPAAGEDEPDNDRLEGMAIMANIRQLLSEGVPAESIAVLGRTHRICRYVAQALDLAGIPHTLADGQGFLGTPELLLMEALVSLLDNAAQDLPLAAVMRSRLHADPEDPGSGCPDGFSEESLLAIRVASDADITSAETADPPRPYFHQAVAWYAQHGPDPMLRDCTAGFLAWLGSLRAREPYLRLTELLALVFERSGYLEYVSQLPDGARRAEELALFSRWADAFESGSQRGLHRFARNLAALRESGMEDSPFEAERTVAGKVRFLTVHGSKGLEFDHVFVAGCGKSLRSRASGRILFAERSGLGPDFVDPVHSVTYPTYARLAMERSLRNASMAEEMRLLYVAMTRAARQLWLTAGIDLDPEKGAPPIARRLRAVRRAGESLPALPAHLPLSAQSFLDWIVMSMARDPDIDWSRIAGTSDPEELLATDAVYASVPQEPGRILLEIRSRQEVISAAGLASGLANTPDAPSAPETPAGEDDRMARRLLVDRLTGPRDAAYADDGVYLGARAHFEKLLLSVYRYPAAASSAAKISVSERKRRAQAYIEAGEAAGEESTSEPADWLQGTGLEIRVAEATSAGTRTPGMLTGADRGTAIHAVLRYLDLHSLGDMPSEEAILRQIRQMLECEMLTPVEAAAVEPLAPLFLRYAQSALGHRVRTAERLGHVYREMPFTLRFDACDIHTEQDPAGFAPGDATLVQGIIDLWFEEAGKEGVVLVDFKSDRISGSPDQVARTLEERYRIQFDHYAAAIERSTGKMVVSRIIWLFDAARGFDIG